MAPPAEPQERQLATDAAFAGGFGTPDLERVSTVSSRCWRRELRISNPSVRPALRNWLHTKLLLRLATDALPHGRSHCTLSGQQLTVSALVRFHVSLQVNDIELRQEQDGIDLYTAAIEETQRSQHVAESAGPVRSSKSIIKRRGSREVSRGPGC